MTKNQIREEIKIPDEVRKEPQAVKKKKQSRENPFGKGIRSVLDGTILTKEKVIRLLPFFFYLTLMAIIYIANTYYAEKTITKIDKINKEIKELRSEYITVKSDFMYKSRQSEISVKLAPYGIKELLTPPEKIIIVENANEPQSSEEKIWK